MSCGIAAIRKGANPLPPVGGGKLYSEADWNTSAQLPAEGYPVSKVGWIQGALQSVNEPAKALNWLLGV